MRRLDHDPDTKRVQNGRHSFCNLIGEPLLDLQSTAEDLDQPRDLAEADHLITGQIGHVTFPEEGQQMMLAQAVEVDVLDDHHLAVVDGEQRVVDHGVDVRIISARQKLERLGDPVRRAQQALTGRVFAHLRQHQLDRLANALLVHG